MKNSQLTQDSGKLTGSFCKQLALYWTDFAEIESPYSGRATENLKNCYLTIKPSKTNKLQYLIPWLLGESGTFLVCFQTVAVLSALGFPCSHDIAQSFLWSGRSGGVIMILQAAIEITCHDHSTTDWVGRCYIFLRYLVFVFRFLFIRWFPCIRHSIIFWGFPHVMVHVPLHLSVVVSIYAVI